MGAPADISQCFSVYQIALGILGKPLLFNASMTGIAITVVRTDRTGHHHE